MTFPTSLKMWSSGRLYKNSNYYIIHEYHWNSKSHDGGYKAHETWHGDDFVNFVGIFRWNRVIFPSLLPIYSRELRPTFALEIIWSALCGQQPKAHGWLIVCFEHRSYEVTTFQNTLPHCIRRLPAALTTHRYR